MFSAHIYFQLVLQDYLSGRKTGILIDSSEDFNAIQPDFRFPVTSWKAEQPMECLLMMKRTKSF